MMNALTLTRCPMLDDHRHHIANTFNIAADTFDAPALSFWSRYGQRTIERLGLQTGDRVLDVCCGSGASAVPAAQRVGPTGAVLGVDLASALLDLGRAKARRQGLTNLDFQEGDFMALELPDEQFTAIVSVFGIFFVPEMEQAVQALWRKLRPGGQLAITSWGKAVFEPASGIFRDLLATERPDLVKAELPWQRIAEPQGLQALLVAGGATHVEVFAERDKQPLATPEDWWTMMMGGGYRGVLEQLDPVMRDRLRQQNLAELERRQITALEVEVLYAIAQK